MLDDLCLGFIGQITVHGVVDLKERLPRGSGNSWGWVFFPFFVMSLDLKDIPQKWGVG